MKKFFYIFSLVFITNNLSAQLLNPNFELWNTTTTDKVDTWISQGKVTKATGGQQGSFAAKLETSIQGFNITSGNLALDNGNSDGYPYANKIDTVKLWVKYNIANADTGYFQIASFNGQDIVRAGEYIFTTGTATAWTEISIPMEVIDTSFNPLTILIAATNTLDYDAQLSSYLIIDNIRCYYKGVLQPNLPNYSFETWNVDTRNDLKDWTSSNELLSQFGLDSINCEQTTVSQNGTYAVKLHSLDIFGTFIPGGIVSGTNQIEAAQDPGNIPTIAVNKRYASLSGYLKFTKKGTDEGEVSIYMFKDGLPVGEGHYFQASTVTNYTLFEAKITYDGTFSGVPDSATIIFVTSKDPQNATGACVMWVDNIQLNTFALGVNPSQTTANKVYPNPFTNEIKIETLASKAIANIISMDGKTMISVELEKGTNTISTNELASGLYILSINDGSQVTTQKLVRQ